MNVPLFSAVQAFEWGFGAGVLFVLALGAGFYWFAFRRKGPRGS